MPKTITIDTEPWCPKDCGYFHLGEDKFYGNDTLLDTYYYCENLPLCRNAVNAKAKYDENLEEIKRVLDSYCRGPEKEVADG